ncbi:MAG: J domain-containing protein [Tateyamaria sp.]|uniref:J domain-containing protein n=2 Tax=Tateyamaria sp. TaxID=1929288 RepID=UPI00329EC066
MAKLTSEMRIAFQCLGVCPGADKRAIRSAWKKMVRTYHPDKYKNDKAAGNRRLAELNAAFDLVCDWSPEGDETIDHAAQNRNSAYQAAQSPKAATEHAAVQRKKQTGLKAQARHQQRLDEAAARKRASELDRQEALRRATVQSAKDANGSQTRPKDKFLAALNQLTTRPTNRFSFSL